MAPKKGVFYKLFGGKGKQPDMDVWLNDGNDPPNLLGIYQENYDDGKYDEMYNSAVEHDSEWAWTQRYDKNKMIPPTIERRRTTKHSSFLNLMDYTPETLKKNGPDWFLKHLYKQLEDAPLTLDFIGNVAMLVIRAFPIVIFNKRASESGRSTTHLISKLMRKNKIAPHALLDVVIDTHNSRAAKKMYNDLVEISKMTKLPLVFINETLIGNYDALKRQDRVGSLEPQLRLAAGLLVPDCPGCNRVNDKNVMQWRAAGE